MRLTIRRSCRGHLRRSTRQPESKASYGGDNPRGEDRNLVGSPRSTFDQERGRPFFDAAGGVNPGTGNVSLGAHRARDNVGSVPALVASLRSRTAQFLRPGLRGEVLNVSYTSQRSQDEATGFALGSVVPATAGDPRVAEQPLEPWPAWR